jgi:hypothetical protein
MKQARLHARLSPFCFHILNEGHHERRQKKLEVIGDGLLLACARLYLRDQHNGVPYTLHMKLISRMVNNRTLSEMAPVKASKDSKMRSSQTPSRSQSRFTTTTTASRACARANVRDSLRPDPRNARLPARPRAERTPAPPSASHIGEVVAACVTRRA